MPRHLPDAELLDLLDAAAAPEVRAHLEGCAACRTRLEQAREGLDAARSAEVPEPPPFYWEAFRAQVRSRIDADASRWRWWRIGPALAAAAAVLALFSLVPTSVQAPRATATPAVMLPAWSALPPAEEDVGLEVLAGLVAGADETRLADGCATLTDCLASLSDEESGRLLETLKSELGTGRKL